jgi:hypothetical protein
VCFSAFERVFELIFSLHMVKIILFTIYIYKITVCLVELKQMHYLSDCIYLHFSEIYIFLHSNLSITIIETKVRFNTDNGGT